LSTLAEGSPPFFAPPGTHAVPRVQCQPRGQLVPRLHAQSEPLSAQGGESAATKRRNGGRPSLGRPRVLDGMSKKTGPAAGPVLMGSDAHHASGPALAWADVQVPRVHPPAGVRLELCLRHRRRHTHATNGTHSAGRFVHAQHASVAARSGLPSIDSPRRAHPTAPSIGRWVPARTASVSFGCLAELAYLPVQPDVGGGPLRRHNPYDDPFGTNLVRGNSSFVRPP
jgi:hypothetical protein